jgi:SAM-dependent methyltransferase
MANPSILGALRDPDFWRDIALNAQQLGYEIAPGTGDVIAVERGGDALTRALRAAEEGDIRTALGKGAEGTAEYLTTLPVAGDLAALGKASMGGLAALGGIIKPWRNYDPRDISAEWKLAEAPAEASQNTQIAQVSKKEPGKATGTGRTYVKADERLGDEGRALDFGAGRGEGTQFLRGDVETFEPFPREGFDPDYVERADIPAEAFDRVLSSATINVTPPTTSALQVRDIARALRPGGEAIITARTPSDVLGAKTAQSIEGLPGVRIGEQYQQGYTPDELIGLAEEAGLTAVKEPGFSGATIRATAPDVNPEWQAAVDAIEPGRSMFDVGRQTDEGMEVARDYAHILPEGELAKAMDAHEGPWNVARLNNDGTVTLSDQGVTPDSWKLYGPGHPSWHSQVTDPYIRQQKIAARGGRNPEREALGNVAEKAREIANPTVKALRGQVSTRYPTAKAEGTPYPTAQHDLMVGMDVLGEADVTKMARLVEDYPNVRVGGSPDETIEDLIEHQQKNLDFIHDQMPADVRERAKQWYVGANRLAHEAAQKHGLSPETTSAVYANLSPQMDWYKNVALGDRLMDINQNQLDVAFTPEMMRSMRRLIDMPKGGWKGAVAQRAEEIANRGMRLGDLDDPVDRAIWTRLYDEGHNPRAYQTVTPEGDRVGNVTTQKGENAKLGWGSTGAAANAIRAMMDPSPASISRSLGQQHKVRNFYNNIYAPHSPRGEATIDTHAVAAGMMRPLAGSDIEVAHNLGAGYSSAAHGVKGTYPVQLEALQRAAALRGHLPREMQSITWEGVRGLFTNKSKPVKEAANAIWNDYRAGKITQEQAQDNILNLAGGIDLPTWYGK